jgi:hypothetical protein
MFNNGHLQQQLAQQQQQAHVMMQQQEIEMDMMTDLFNG